MKPKPGKCFPGPGPGGSGPADDGKPNLFG